MNTRKIFGYSTFAVIIMLLVCTLSLTGCPNDSPGGDLPFTEVTVSNGNTLAEKLQWVKDNAQSNTSYTIQVSSDEAISPHELSYTGKSDIKIILRGSGSAREISLSETGRLFIVESGVTLVLDNNITLKGRSDNTVSLVRVHKGGALIMNAGAKISGNTSIWGSGVEVSNGTFTMSGGEISDNTASREGGGVNVSNEGTFTMSGGEISGNTASSGGGVEVYEGTFTMTGGKITGNTAEADSWAGGGGVSVGDNATFTMRGGEISGNTAKSNSDSAGGGGVNVGEGATFTMSGTAKIFGNTAEADSWAGGGGVYIYQGTFTMQGGEISDNTAKSNSDSEAADGGGVHVGEGATFTMSGTAKISGNTAEADFWAGGGGVNISKGTFTMNGGEISGNTAGGGGGVCLNADATFRIVNGTVYGSDEGVLSNTATNGSTLRNYDNGTAQHGTFSGTTWTSKGNLTTTNDTIKVVNGELAE